MISFAFDFSQLPAFPAPWTIENGRLVSRGRDVRAVGACTTGYSCLPSSRSQAGTWVSKIWKMGFRVWRPHHLDIAIFRDNPSAHIDKLNWMLDACDRKGMAVFWEFGSEYFDKGELVHLGTAEIARWSEYVELLVSRLNWRPVVAATPYNELPLRETAKANTEVYEHLAGIVRSVGYRGLLFGSNSVDAPSSWGSVPGDLQDWHAYCDHRVGEGFFNSTYAPQWWIHRTPTPGSPFVLTEGGHMWPAETRGVSERQIYEDAIGKGAQVIIPFALATKASHWSTNSERPEIYCFQNDPDRMETLRWLVHRMNSLSFVPAAYDPSLRARRVGEIQWQIE